MKSSIFYVLFSLFLSLSFSLHTRQAPLYSARIRKFVKWCGRWGVRMQQAPSRGLAPMAGVPGTSSRMTTNRRQVAAAAWQQTDSSICIPVEIMSLNVRKSVISELCVATTPTFGTYAGGDGGKGMEWHDTNYKFINDGETGKTSEQTKCCCMMNCALIEINCVCACTACWAWPWGN